MQNLPNQEKAFKQDANKLTIALLFMVIFILLGGLVSIILYTQDQVKQYEQRVTDLKNEVASQKSEKNAVRDIWLDQAIQNDKLVTGQQNVLNQIDNYKAELAISFRFIDNQPQFLPTINEARLKKSLDQLNQEVKNLDELTIENTNTKNKNKAAIDTLYLNSGEVQPNTAK